MIGPLALGISTTPFSIAFRAVMLAGATFLALKVLLFPKRIQWSRGTVWLLAFFAIYACRFIYDVYVLDIQMSPSLMGKAKLAQFLFGSSIIPILGISTIALPAMTMEKSIFYMSLLQCLAITYIFFVLYGATTDAFVSRYYLATLFEESDLGKPINPIIISRAGGILAVCSLFSFSVKKWIRIVAFGLGVVLLLLGSSRGPVFAFLVCVLLASYKFIVRGEFEMILLKIFGAILLGLLIIFVVGSVYESLNLGIVERLVKMTESSGKGEERIYTWAAAWEQFRTSPVYGDKIVENYTLTYPHNLFLEVLMAVGLVGFIPFVIAVWKAITKALKLYRNSIRVAPMLFFFLLLSVLFSGSIILSPEYWLSMIVIYNIRE